MAHDPGFLPSSPQGVRKTFINSHQLPTVETSICAGQRAMPTPVNGCYLCGRTSGGSELQPRKPLTCVYPAADALARTESTGGPNAASHDVPGEVTRARLQVPPKVLRVMRPEGCPRRV
jgi:hypothetical protein